MTAAMLLSLSAILVVGETAGYAKSVSITPGVEWQSDQQVISKRNQFVNTLQVDLKDPYTLVDFGTSDPLEKRTVVTELAKMHTMEKNHVVGAVNASFFHMDSGKPAFLLSKNDRIKYLGSAAGVEASFGINSEKTAQIAPYTIDIVATHNGQPIKISSYNRSRTNNSSILYTSSFRYSDTRANNAGYEVVVSGLPKSIDQQTSFGEKLTGKVSAIRPYGQGTSSKIPNDGFVLSATGTKMEDLKDMAIGDDVSIELNINEEWKGANSILASGPLLVDDGKVNTNIVHSTAALRTARTAIAIDTTGKKVFMVTIDSGKKGKSEGLTLNELASQLVKMGAYKAINLDGGGSTTMAARIPGNRYASLVNVPSGGSQRAVSAIMEVISTAPYGQPAKITVNQNGKTNLLVGADATYNVTSALDSYNNVLGVASNPATYTVEGNIGRLNQSKFIAEKAGTGSVVVKAGTAVTKVPVTVVAQPTKLTSNVSSIYIGKGKSDKISISAFDKAGKNLVFNSNQVKWSVSGKIGNIKADGTFTSGQAEAKGSIIATLNGKKLTIPVTVSDKPLLLSSLDVSKQWKASSAKAKTAILQKSGKSTKEGKGYLGLSYDFTGYKTASVSASYMSPVSKMQIPSKPTSLSLWVWADAKNHWLRGKVKDKNGKVYTIDFTQEGKLNWRGQWKQLTAKIPAGVAYPVSVESIYVTEAKSTNKNKGAIYLDALRANYK